MMMAMAMIADMPGIAPKTIPTQTPMMMATVGPTARIEENPPRMLLIIGGSPS